MSCNIIMFQVQVKCSLIYMDFEGRSDGRSIKAILGHVAPLKLVCLFLIFDYKEEFVLNMLVYVFLFYLPLATLC